jgi:hypothetical protein
VAAPGDLELANQLDNVSGRLQETVPEISAADLARRRRRRSRSPLPPLSPSSVKGISFSLEVERVWRAVRLLCA